MAHRLIPLLQYLMPQEQLIEMNCWSDAVWQRVLKALLFCKQMKQCLDPSWQDLAGVGELDEVRLGIWAFGIH